MAIYSKKYLTDVLKRDSNNFDILRLLAAISVIIGHAYAINPQPPLEDGVLNIIHFDFSGAVAVKFFFFLSGLLVTNSIISNPNIIQFLIKRVFRIFPGLLVCLLIAVFIVGPIYTELPLSDYFSSAGTWEYLQRNFFLKDMRFRLTGVFTKSPWGLNGALWTLLYEVMYYMYLAFFSLIGLLKNKFIANLFCIIIIAGSIIVHIYSITIFSHNTDAYLLPASFAIGSLSAINKDFIRIQIYPFILLWIVAFILRNTTAYQYFFYLALFYSAMYISSLNFVITRLKIPFDASYGIYIYGFMIQQCVHATLPTIGVHGNQIVSISIASILGILLWYFVEKPFIKLGQRLINLDILSSKTVYFLKDKKWRSKEYHSQ
ncbi:MAG TPA: acyltransferase [Ferruginibacter sp.]|nr:acyltransferase [Ferruginibacter sp.]